MEFKIGKVEARIWSSASYEKATNYLIQSTQIAEADCLGDITECGGACYTRKGLPKEVINELKGVKNDKSKADI